MDDKTVKEGSLGVTRSSGGKKDRTKELWVVLREGHLYFFRNQAEALRTKMDKVKKTGKNVLDLKLCKVQAVPGEGSGFTVTVASGEQYLFEASSDEVRTDWSEVFMEVSVGAELTREMVEVQERLRMTGHAIDPSEIEMEEDKEVGRGASGIVRKGLWLKSTPVAVKALGNLPEFTDPKELLQFYKEIETLSKLHQPYIVQMFGFCKKDGFLCLVTEFVAGGNLSDALKNPEYQLDDPLRVTLALNICRGMMMLHNIGLIHRDLKPANVLIETWAEGKVKICDFGLSTIGQSTKKKKKGGSGAGAAGGADDEEEEVVFGSPQYAAPELRQEDHTEKVDVFSFAIILWQIYARKLPWGDELNWSSQYAERYESGMRPEVPRASCFKGLIEICWTQDPSQRPAFKDIYASLEATQKSLPPTAVRGGPGSGSAAGGPPIPAVRQPGPPPGGARVGAPPPHHGGPQPVLPGAGRGQAPPLPGYMGMTSASSMQNLLPGGGQPGSLSNSGGAPTSPTAGRTVGAAAAGGGAAGGAAASGPVEQQIFALFGGAAEIPFAHFASGVSAIFGGMPPTALDCLRFVLCNDGGAGAASRARIETVLKWFNPLSVGDSESVYNTIPAAQDASPSFDTGGYTMEMLIEVLGPQYFHGHLSPDQAQTLLRDQPEGTFLFRFSSNPGAYTLSVSYHGVVGHWRIQCVKAHGEAPRFMIEHREYRSLQHIISTHRVGGESLKVTRVVQGQPATCYLRQPLNRAEPSTFASDSIYNA